MMMQVMMQITTLVQMMMQTMGDGVIHDNDKHVMVEHDILYIITKNFVTNYNNVSNVNICGREKV
jgi:hypothetical protein